MEGKEREGMETSIVQFYFFLMKYPALEVIRNDTLEKGVDLY